jgi:regulatory protein
VYLDGEYAFSVDSLLASELKIGQQLSGEQVKKIKAKDAARRARQLSFRYLSYRPRSKAEVRNYLRQKGFDEIEAEMAVDELEERQYLDDRAFADYWVEQRLIHRPRGIIALRHELAQKGVSSAIAEVALRDVDEKDAALQAAEKRVQRWSRMPRDEFRRKISDFLKRRGFSYPTIREVADSVWLSIEDGRTTQQ